MDFENMSLEECLYLAEERLGNMKNRKCPNCGGLMTPSLGYAPYWLCQESFCQYVITTGIDTKLTARIKALQSMK